MEDHKLLIGSKAMRRHWPDFPREPKDTDYAILGKTNSTQDIEYLHNPILIEYMGDASIASPTALLTLKMSHLMWDINWQKHMFDVQFMLKKGVEYDEELWYKLVDFWKVYHPANTRSELKMSSEDFFDNALKSEHDHDFLHTLIKDPPTYTKVLIGEVEPCPIKFQALSHEDKLGLVSEEVMIMAYERFRKLTYRQGYELMLKKFIIAHAPIWEVTFIIHNYIELLKPKFNFYKTIDEKLTRIKSVS